MLKNYVSVYVPGTKGKDRITRKIQDAIAQDTATRLSGKLGGCTILPADGCWVNAQGELIRERILICKAYYADDPGAVEFAQGIARGIKQNLSQDAVTVETQEGIDFI